MEFNGTFFATIISFLAFVYVMNKLLYLPVRKIVDERNGLINGNYQAADENNSKVSELSEEMDKQIAGAKEDARGKYNEILAGYKNKKADIVKDAQSKSHDELEQAYADLNNVSNSAKDGLKSRMADLANDIVEKVLGYRSEVQGFDNESVDKILYR